MSGAPEEDPAAEKGHTGAVRAGHGLGVVLATLGFVGTLMGLVLSSLCWVAEGIVCSGTAIGSFGATGLLLGGSCLVAGFALIALTRQRFREAARSRGLRLQTLARADLARSLQADLVMAKGGLEPAIPSAPVPSVCPSCSGPIPRGAASCEWCGQLFR